MAKFKCLCGNVLSFQKIPNPIEFLVFRDTDVDEKFDKTVEELFSDNIRMVVCLNCLRLWIYWNGFDVEPFSYQLELEEHDFSTPDIFQKLRDELKVGGRDFLMEGDDKSQD